MSALGAVFLSSIALAATAHGASPSAPPAAVMTRAIRAHGLPPASVSYLIVDTASGRVVASARADEPRSPASTLKVVTTFATLDTLGPAFVWRTRALSRGTVVDGRLDGDLVLKGGGDPYMTLERWWRFVAQLRAAGLRQIHGDVIVDDGAFALPTEDPGAFDGQPNRPYNGVPDALLVNFQTVEFRLTPDPAAHRIDIAATPALANLEVRNDVHLVPGRCRAGADRVEFDVQTPAWDRVDFSGTLASDCESRTLTRVLLRPAEYAYGAFVTLWHELGGELHGRLRIERAPADAHVLEDFESLPLGEVIRLTNKFSNNVMARHLLLTLGAERYGYPATLEKGAAALKDWAHGHGIDLDDVDVDNGAGLSRVTRVSARQLEQVLQTAYHSRFAPEFLASLPLGGIDGTLRHRMHDAPPGAVRLKTGHLDGVSGVAGYVTGGSGKTYVVVCLVNDPRVDTGAAEPVQADLVRWILDAL